MQALHPIRSVPGTSPTFAERTLSKIEFGDACWRWTGAVNSDGYGKIGRGSRGQGEIRAHRAVYELLVGPIPDGLVIDHLCRNRACVNPEHLEPVTLAVNILRGVSISAVHAARDTCRFGHPKDGVFGARGSNRTYRYCKTCVTARNRARRGRTS